MTQYGALRTWAAVLTVAGSLGFVLAAAGTIIWAIEVEGTWPMVGRLLLGGSVSVFLAVLAAAAAHALRALADVGETLAAG